MTVIKGSSEQVAIDNSTASPLHTANKPVPYGALGHYRVAFSFGGYATAAGRAIFEIRNADPTVTLVPTRLRVGLLNYGDLAQEYLIDLNKLTNHTAVYSTGAAALTPSKTRTAMPASSAEVVGCNSVSGMTGGSRVREGPLVELPVWSTVTTPTASTVAVLEMRPDDPASPLVLAYQEGLEVFHPAAGSGHTGGVYIDFSWAEVSAY